MDKDIKESLIIFNDLLKTIINIGKTKFNLADEEINILLSPNTNIAQNKNHQK